MTNVVHSTEWTAARQIIALLRRLKIRPVWLIGPILLSLTAAAFEGMSVGLLIPLIQGFLQHDFSFVQHTAGLSTVVRFITQYISISDRSLFGIIIGLFVIAVMLKGILRYISTVLMTYVGLRSLHNLRKALFTRYMRFGKLFFDRTNIGYHASVLTEFASNSLRPLFTVDKYVNALFSLCAYLFVMASISWKLTVFALPLFAILHFSVQTIIRKVQQTSHRGVQWSSAMTNKVIEIFSTMTLVKSYNAEDHEKSMFADISERRTRVDFRDSYLQNFIPPFQEIITLFSALLLFSVMLYLMVRGGEATPPAFIVYFYLMINAAAKFGTMTGLRGNLAGTLGPLKEVTAVFDDTDKAMIAGGDRPFSGLRDRVDIRDLHFSYAPDREILKGISLTIERGKMTAFVGATGEGKSTLTHLLLRFYDCPPNSIFLDNVDIRTYDIASLRQGMALVSQETLLLHTSLRDNITYGLTDVTDDALREALRRARLEPFVAGLPQGLDTLIGDRGVKLSGGEKQRVSIARALLKGADILILDEATSSLDSMTERLIQEAIDEAVKERTAIVIAHRLSTIRHADKIVVIEDGRCREQGTMDELLAMKGKFFALWEEQKFF